MKKITPLLVVVFVAALIFSPVFAESYSIIDNGEGSNNSVKINESDTKEVIQSNEGNITNEVTNRGGIINITNEGNINQTSDPCCPAAGPSATPKPGDPGSPKATPVPETGGNGNGTGGTDISSGGTSGGSDTGTGGGEVLGLSATSSADYDRIGRLLFSVICIAVGSRFLQSAGKAPEKALLRQKAGL